MNSGSCPSFRSKGAAALETTGTGVEASSGGTQSITGSHPVPYAVLSPISAFEPECGSHVHKGMYMQEADLEKQEILRLSCAFPSPRVCL